MKWLLTLESFSSKLNKKYFVVYDGTLVMFGGDDSDIAYKLDHVLIKNVFDEIIVLSEMTLNQITKWSETIKPGDMVYCHTPKYLDTDYMKFKTMNHTYKLLSKKKGIKFWINDSFVSSKGNFYNLLKNFDFMPKTCFSKEEALETLTFPIVAKPDDGSHGYGIQKFNTKKELQDSKLKFDLYSEYIKHKYEFRVFVILGKIVYIVERVNKYENKNNIDHKTKDSNIKFVYVPQEFKGFPYLKKIQKMVDSLDKKLRPHNGSVYSIDIFIDDNDEVKVIEANSKSELDPYSFIRICKNLFDIPYHIQFLMDEVENLYIKSEYGKYSKQIKKSFYPIDYDIRKPDSDFLEFVNSYDVKSLS